MAYFNNTFPGFIETVFQLDNMAPPLPTTSRQTRSQTVNTVDSSGSGSGEKTLSETIPNNPSEVYRTPVFTLIPPVDPLTATSRKEQRQLRQQAQKGKGKVVFNSSNASQETLPPLPPSIPNLDVNNNNTSNQSDALGTPMDSSPKRVKQTAPLITATDVNNPEKEISQHDTSNDLVNNNNVPPAGNANIDIPDMEMHIDDQSRENVLQPYTLEQQRFQASLHVPMHESSDLQDLKKFMKIVQQNIMEDPDINLEDFLNFTITTVTQKIANGGTSDPTSSTNLSQPIGMTLKVVVTSKDTLNQLLQIPYNCDEQDYYFKEIISHIVLQRERNQQKQDRVVQIFNASTDITTAMVKAFMKKFGEIVEEECYSRRSSAHAPNRRTFYVVFKDSASVTHFYTNQSLWIYGEMLYVTPLLMDKEHRDNLRKFSMKLNGLPPNAKAVEFKKFIEEFEVLEFYIPKNTYTDEAQKYAYVYFKDEEQLTRATKEVLMCRNKQLEWSHPSEPSCYRCGYIGHFLRDCDFVPVRTRPMSRAEYSKQVRELRQQRFANRRGYGNHSRTPPPPRSYADAVKYHSRQHRNYDNNLSFRRRNNNNNRYWNARNLQRKSEFEDDTNYYSSYDEVEDDNVFNDSEYEDMMNWDEPPRRQAKTSPHRNLDKQCEELMGGTRKGGSIHMQPKERQEFQHQQKMDSLHEIKNDFAKMKDMMDTMLKEQQQMKKDLDIIRNNNNVILKDRSTNNSKQEYTNKRKVTFATGSKRTRGEDLSDSDSAAANNVLLLSQQLDESDKRFDTMFSMFNKMHQSLETICASQGNTTNTSSTSNATVGGNSNVLSYNTHNNY